MASPPPSIVPAWLLVALAGAGPVAAQEPGGAASEIDPERDQPLLGRTVVTATRSAATAFDTPYSAEVVDSELVLRRGYRTLPEALADVPGVMVQKTAHGQGSPYIRGFTGFRNLFLIDGVRLNNSVFRDGPNQYWSTVDPFSIERLEVIKGPSSVLYGSDAVGGTVNAITVSPYGYGDGTNAAGRAFYRYATAEDSHIGRGEISVTRGDSLGFLAGATGKDFGDLRAGEGTGTQPNTGYQEGDVDLKLEHFIDPDLRLVLLYQHVEQHDVPRTHRTVFAVPFEGTTVGTDLRRDLDQQRDLAYVQLRDVDDEFALNLSWQKQQEQRKRVRTSGADRQGFDVGTLGLFGHAVSPSAIGRLTWGFDYYHDEVDSFSSSNPIQGPVADDATYDLFGLFLQDEIEAHERLTFTLGGRYNLAAVDADSVADPISGTPTSISDTYDALVGSARFTYGLSPERWSLFGGVSQGFRAPNLSDLTRLDSARTNELEVPSPGLDPERFVGYELGIKGRTESLSLQTAAFYTDIEDAIVRVPTGGVNPAGEVLVTKDNVGDGSVYGLELGAAWRFAPRWTLFGNTTYVEGEVDTFPTSAPVKAREPIDRLMPWTSQLGLRFEEPSGWWTELQCVGATDADRLSTRDKGDTSRIPPGGTPGYLVVNLRGGWELGRHLRLFLGLENIGDVDYRIHGSGVNQPGRNLVFSIDARF